MAWKPKDGILNTNADAAQYATPWDYQAHELKRFASDWLWGAGVTGGMGGIARGSEAAAGRQAAKQLVAKAAARGALAEAGPYSILPLWLVDHVRTFDNALQNRLATRQYAKAFNSYDPYEDH